MGGMEHAENTLGVPPLVDQRILSQFCRAVQHYADGVGYHDQAAEKLRNLRARLEALRDLAKLCRLAVLGHRNSFERVCDEMRCIAADFPSGPLCGKPDDISREDEPEVRVQFGAVVDLLAGAAFVSKDDPALCDRLIIGLVRAVEDAIAYPVGCADEAAAYVGEGANDLSPTHCALVIANATKRLLEGDLRCDPLVPCDISARLEGLAHKWMCANPVTELFRALTGPQLDRIVEAVRPDDAHVGDRVTLFLDPSCVEALPQEDLSLEELATAIVVLFCPREPARIVGFSKDQLRVEVPKNARTGPVAVVRGPERFSPADVNFLLQRYACEYPVEWFYSVFSAIPMYRWAYPVAFGRPLIEITQVPERAVVRAFSSAGELGKRTPVSVGQPVAIHYKVYPPGSDANASLTIDSPAGQVTHAKAHGVLVYRAQQGGDASITLGWGDLEQSVHFHVTSPTPEARDE